jgi:antitoxin CptB
LIDQPISESESRSRLAWRCRRGTKELDLLLLGWLARSFDSASAYERAAFAALLELPDPELADCLLGVRQPPNAALAAAVAAIRPGAEPSAVPGIQRGIPLR